MKRKMMVLLSFGWVCLTVVACGGATAAPPPAATPLPAPTDIPATEAPPTEAPPTATNPPPTEPPAAPPESAVAPATELTERMDSYLTQLTDAGRFAGAVLVARGDEIIFTNGYGLADRELGVANTTETRYRVASLTKIITALAILQLQEQGKLNVTDAACDYLADCPTDWESVTIDQLLTHSSGIPNYSPLVDRTTPISPTDAVAAVRDRPLGGGYSNTNYVLLGLIIEQVSGQPYATYVRENILDPLGMTNSGFDETADNLAKGYLFGKPVDVDFSIPAADGSLYSTVGDMFLLARALRSEQLVSSESLAAMFTPVMPGGWSPGYGIIIGRLHGQPAWGVGGPSTAVDGYAADFIIYPEEEVTSIVLSNQQDTSTDPIGEGLSGWALADE